MTRLYELLRHWLKLWPRCYWCNRRLWPWRMMTIYHCSQACLDRWLPF